MRSTFLKHFVFVAIAAGASFGQSASAQIQKYNPNTGQYSTTDAFGTSVDTSSSPNRINRRIASRVDQAIASQGGAANGRSTSIDNAGPAPSTAISTSQFSTMGDMAMYGDASASGDPFAKPDWWPQ